MTPVQWGLLVWGMLLLLFLGLEIPAIFHLVPWPTLSSETNDGITYWEPLRVCILALLFVLGMHLAFRLSALPLVLVAAGTIAGLIFHYILLIKW